MSDGMQMECLGNAVNVDGRTAPFVTTFFSILVTGTNCNELGGGQRRLDSGATGVGRSGSHNNEKTQSDDGIIIFNDLKLYGHMYNLIPVTTDVFITGYHYYWGSGRPASGY